MRSSSSIIITRCRDIFISLLALAAIGWQQTPDGNRGTLGTARAVAHQNQQAVATQLALQQLTQQGSYDSLMEAFQAARSRIEPLETISIEAPRASNFASNPWQHFRAFFAADSVQVLPATADQSVARWRASLTGYGRQQSQQPVVTVEPVVRENRLEYVRGTLTEWYINDPRGLEQGFTLAEPPAAEDGQMGGFLVLTMAVESNLEPKPSPQGDSITFVSTDGEVRLRYSGLKAWDATGRQLPGRIEASEGKIALVVDDADAVYPVTVDPLIFSETKLTASDAAGGDLFGASVAISGETIVVGAPNGDTAAGFDSGSAYVFVRSGSVWSEQAKLTASDAAGGDLFGHRVAISGDTVVVGAPLDKNAAGFDFGSAYVFVRSGSVWSEQAKLTASDAAGGDEFGWSVAISGETIVVGALFGDTAAGPDSGSAYVFVRSGSVWSEQAKLTASGGDEFGWSVAISGETIVVGAPFGDTAAGPDSGSAYVFVRSGSVWSEQAKLIASDAAAGDHFGRSVAISGETIVVGAPSDDTAAGFDSGSAYVFVRSGSVWSEQAKLTASDAAEGDEFGFSVAISGDTVVVGVVEDSGGFGSAYVFVNVTEADLLISMGVDKTNIRQGDLLTYTITVHNFGPNRAVNTVVNDMLSSGTTFVGASANKGNFTAPPPGQTGTVTWYLGDLLDGDQEAAQIQVTVIVRGRTTITNSATVYSETFDPNLANNSAAITVSVLPGRKK